MNKYFANIQPHSIFFFFFFLTNNFMQLSLHSLSYITEWKLEFNIRIDSRATGNIVFVAYMIVVHIRFSVCNICNIHSVSSRADGQIVVQYILRKVGAEEVCFKLSFKRWQRRGEANIRWQRTSNSWNLVWKGSCASTSTFPVESYVNSRPPKKSL